METGFTSDNEWAIDSLSNPEGLDRAGRLQSASIVRGVSLSGVLQMLHLERKTCVLEVVSEHRFGTLTLVNGELVDAAADDLEGEEAALRILSWPRPQTTIMDGVSLFRHTVDMPLSRLLLEVVRREDELDDSSRPSLAAIDRSIELSSAAPRFADWDHLVEALVITGAIAAAVLAVSDGRVIALADEFDGAIDGLSATALTELIPVTTGLRDWLLHSNEAEDLVIRLSGLQLLVHPLGRDSGHVAYALFDSTEALDRIRAAIRTSSRA